MKKNVLKFIFVLVLIIGIGNVSANIIYNLYDNNDIRYSNPDTLKYYKIFNTDGSFYLAESSYSKTNINYSNLTEEEVLKLNDLTKYSIFDNNGNMYSLNKGNYKSNVDVNDVEFFNIFNDELKLVVLYDDIKNEWVIYHATILVNDGLNSKYFIDLTDAFKYAKDGNVINLLDDQYLLDSIIVSSNVTLNGNGKKIVSMAANLFNVTNASKLDVVLNNIDLEVKSFIKMSKNSLNRMIINNSVITYKVMGIPYKYRSCFEISENTIFSLPLN